MLDLMKNYEEFKDEGYKKRIILADKTIAKGRIMLCPPPNDARKAIKHSIYSYVSKSGRWININYVYIISLYKEPQSEMWTGCAPDAPEEGETIDIKGTLGCGALKEEDRENFYIRKSGALITGIHINALDKTKPSIEELQADWAKIQGLEFYSVIGVEENEYKGKTFKQNSIKKVLSQSEATNGGTAAKKAYDYGDTLDDEVPF